MTSAEGDVLETLGTAGARWESKSQQVREVFENAPHYLKGRQVDIRFRVATVKQYASQAAWQRAMDIGCGDGTITLQLLAPEKKLTLLDLSANMTAIAKSKVPQSLAANVTVRNENFAVASFGEETFDLIVTVGVMAHVDSPDEFLGKIRKLLRPGGNLIVEFTDGYHFMGRLERFVSRIKEVIRPGKFRTNRLSFADVAQLFERHNLKLESTFRYAILPIPEVQKYVSAGLLYRVVSLVFGNCTNNRNAWLGNEYICRLTAI